MHEFPFNPFDITFHEVIETWPSTQALLLSQTPGRRYVLPHRRSLNPIRL